MIRLVTAMMICALLLASLAAQAGMYKFTPQDADLNELPHANYFTWGIQWTVPTNEVITKATLTYKNIWDWTTESNDRLYTHLLDTVNDPNSATRSPNWVTMPAGYKTITITKTDNEGGGDNFAGQGYLLGVWSDPKGGSNGKYAVDVTYDIPLDKYSWLLDGNMGFGIDADCHYYNCGVELEVITQCPPDAPVPEASTLMLASLGAMSLGGLRILRRK